MAKDKELEVLKSFYIGLFIALFSPSLFAQYEQIKDSVNLYYSVTGFNASYVQLKAGTDLSGLEAGDKVVLMQMTGVPYNGGDPVTDLMLKPNWANTGRYVMLAVASVDDGTDRVYFTASINTAAFTNGEKMQLIKIYEADYAEVTGTITAPDWNGETGGVVAMVIFKKLILSADINVNSKGFRGGEPEPDYPGICRNWGWGVDTFYFADGDIHKAGQMGEGNKTVSFPYSMGPGYLGNGGGGGLGYFSGGGGGSHAGKGGYGGSQWSGCDETIIAFPGDNASRTSNFYGFDRVTMGGGGGSSTQDATHIATKGGDGGGIVIILADTLQGNGHSILANGEPVSTNASAGGGGGGAGGAVLLDINQYETNLNLSVRGGKGGNTGTEPNGAGGGGGGGIVWYAGTTLPGAVSVSRSGGTWGLSGDANLDGTLGENGATEDSLRLPLNGFLFNSLGGVDTLCTGQTPNLITASMPKGGTSGYTYTWLQSTDSSNWTVIAGAIDSLFYQPPALTQTTYYTREVSSGPITDVALPVKIVVYNDIGGNMLDISEILCYNESPGTISIAGPLTGGDGTYQYAWESRTDADWQDRGNSEELSEGNLKDTTYYRRIVVSAGVCTDTSNVDVITVLDTIRGNNFTHTDTAVCWESDGGTLSLIPASGGDGGYSYQWTASDGISAYIPLAGETAQSYSPGIMDETTFYRREVRFGPGDACLHTSNTFLLEVYPLIVNNKIDGDPLQYACDNTSKTLQGIAGLGGGSGDGFNFTWEESLDATVWNNASGSNTEASYQSPPLTAPIYCRRVVKSGDYDQCQSVSDTVLINIYPLAGGDIISGAASACSGEIIAIGYENLEGDGPWTIGLGVDNITYTASGLITSSGVIDFPVAESGYLTVLDLLDVHGCHAGLSGNTGNIDLTVYEWPDPFAGEDAMVCGQVVSLGAVQTGEAGLWTGTGEFSDPTDANTQLTIDDFSGSITHTFQWKEWNWQCADSAEVELTFYEPPEQPVIPEPPLLDYTFEYQLDAPIPVGEGLWTQLAAPDGGEATFEDAALHNTLVYFTDFTPGVYQLEWTVTNGSCPAVSATAIITIGKIEFFTGFSPNGDGINDEYLINLSGRTTATFLVFDRWGNQVFYKEGVDEIRWNGKNTKDTDLPEGTYFYILSQDAVRDVERGYIELRR